MIFLSMNFVLMLKVLDERENLDLVLKSLLPE